MNAGYLSAGAIIAMLGLWSVERSTEQAASADRRIVELLEIANQKQCVKDAKAAGSPLGQRFIDGVALTRIWGVCGTPQKMLRAFSRTGQPASAATRSALRKTGSPATAVANWGSPSPL